MKLVSLAIIVAGALVASSILAAHGLISLPRPDYEVAVAERLVNPESARFRNVDDRRTGGGDGVCGEMDSKNRLGGYVGWTGFFARPNGTKKWDVYFADDEVTGHMVDEFCS